MISSIWEEKKIPYLNFSRLLISSKNGKKNDAWKIARNMQILLKDLKKHTNFKDREKKNMPYSLKKLWTKHEFFQTWTKYCQKTAEKKYELW